MKAKTFIQRNMRVNIIKCKMEFGNCMLIMKGDKENYIKFIKFTMPLGKEEFKNCQVN